jgi:hypothetical protein
MNEIKHVSMQNRFREKYNKIKEQYSSPSTSSAFILVIIYKRSLIFLENYCLVFAHISLYQIRKFD